MEKDREESRGEEEDGERGKDRGGGGGEERDEEIDTNGYTLTSLKKRVN